MYKNRFITKHRPLDWNMILIKLKHAGLSCGDLGDIVGKSAGSISHMVSEASPHPEEWDSAFALLDLYTMLHRDGDNEVALPRLTETKPFNQRIKRVRHG